MNSRETLVPYCQAVRILVNEQQSVFLSGTGNMPAQDSGIYCNYISVEPISPCKGAMGTSSPSKGFYQVIPSGTEHYRDGNPYSSKAHDPSANGVVVSGMVGATYSSPADLVRPNGPGAGVLGGNSTICTLSLQRSHMVSSIAIKNNFDTSAMFLVNYGVVQHSNPRADQDTPIGS